MDPADFHAMMDRERPAEPEEPPAEEEGPLFHERRYRPWETNPVKRKNSERQRKDAMRLWRQRINARTPA
jgi:hypothetical protein